MCAIKSCPLRDTQPILLWTRLRLEIRKKKKSSNEDLVSSAYIKKIWNINKSSILNCINGKYDFAARRDVFFLFIRLLSNNFCIKWGVHGSDLFGFGLDYHYFIIFSSPDPFKFESKNFDPYPTWPT
jgi:hypothetical protein